MRKYKHLFFDLDHTLWDFDANSIETLTHLFDVYQLGRFFESFDAFFQAYQPINIELWDRYSKRQITSSLLNVQRFYLPLKMAGYDNLEFATRFANDFITLNPQKTQLMPHALELLTYLKPHYKMHIVTNGFIKTQFVKLELSGIRQFFKHIFISESIGASKPHRDFFDHAIKSANARKKESLVIGDSLENDVLGAQKAGVDSMYYNYNKQLHQSKPTFEVFTLREAMHYL